MNDSAKPMGINHLGILKCVLKSDLYKEIYFLNVTEKLIFKLS